MLFDPKKGSRKWSDQKVVGVLVCYGVQQSSHLTQALSHELLGNDSHPDGWCTKIRSFLAQLRLRYEATGDADED